MNLENLKKFYKENSHNVTMGHFNINSFEVVPGHTYTDGMDSKMFKNFKLVLSGHFHNKQTKGNITYVGTSYDITWSEHGVKKGFHIINENHDLEFIENKNGKWKYWYHGSWNSKYVVIESIKKIEDNERIKSIDRT